MLLVPISNTGTLQPGDVMCADRIQIMSAAHNPIPGKRGEKKVSKFYQINWRKKVNKSYPQYQSDQQKSFKLAKFYKNHVTLN